MERALAKLWTIRSPGTSGNADDAGSFYAAVLPDASVEVVASYPTENIPDFQRELAGKALVVDVSVSGYRIRLINAGREYRPTPALSFIVNMDPLRFDCGEEGARARIASMWDAFSTVPEAEQCGWLVNQFGVSWQIVPENMGSLLQHPGAYQRMLSMKKIVIADL